MGPVYCWQLLPRLPQPLRLTPPSCTEPMVVWDMPVSMEDTHMLPLLCSLMLLLSPVTLSQLLLEVTRLSLDPTETLLDPSMEVTSVEGINGTISLEVIDIKGKFNCVNFLLLKTKLSHDDCWVAAVDS